MANNFRARVIISGKVQGVWFRAETQRAARRIGVSGWVRNVSDGTVEAVFEGPRQLVEDAIAWCHQGSPASRVSDVNVTWEDYTGEFETFDVTY
jgi:acylphosphatase